MNFIKETVFDKRHVRKSNKRGTSKQTRKHRRKWSIKYKKKINCQDPRGFSQKQYCKYGRKKST
jgi:hypothetical protein